MQYLWTLKKTVEIDAAHRLPKHPGKCQYLHGHRWKVTVEVGVNELDSQGMVLDFSHISEFIKKLDHGYMNDRLSFDPTAERISKWIAEGVSGKVGRPCGVSVTVEETPGSQVTFKHGISS